MDNSNFSTPIHNPFSNYDPISYSSNTGNINNNITISPLIDSSNNEKTNKNKSHFCKSPLQNSNSDWKKVVSDRLVSRIMKYREQRVDFIRVNKDEILKDIQYDQVMDYYGDEDNLMMSEYFDKILQLFENQVISPGEYEIELGCNSNISTCPLCYYPVILTSRKILCSNLCFQYDIPNNIINADFSLDNFVDLLGRACNEHKACINTSNATMELLIFEDDANIVCSKCLNEIY